MQKFTTSASLASNTLNKRGCSELANFDKPNENRNLSKLFMIDTMAFEFCEVALYARKELNLSAMLSFILGLS
jgi:hypothetical protein